MRTFPFVALFTLFIALFASLAQAQVSDSDDGGKTELRILGQSWTSSFYSLASFESDKVEDSGGRLSTYNYFSFHTYLGDDLRFSLRLPFLYNSAGTDRFNGSKNNNQELEMSDIILEVRDPHLLYLPWDIGAYWALRLYTPNSKFSEQSGQIARFGNHFIFSKMLNRTFEFDVEQRTNYYWQSRATYRNSFIGEDGFEVRDVASLTKQYQLQEWFHLWANLKPKLGVGLGAIFQDTFYNHSAAEAKYKDPERVLQVGPQVRFAMSDWASFIFIYQDEVNRQKNLNEAGQFLAKNRQYVLHSFISF